MLSVDFVISVIALILSIIGVFLVIYYNYNSGKLSFQIEKEHFTDAQIVNLPNNPVARYFHITICNEHGYKTAKNCRIYLTSLKEENDEKELITTELPLKWKGYQPYIPIDIYPKERKKFDAFFVLHQKPDTIQLQAITDSTAILPKVHGELRLHAKYKISADGCKSREETFIINLSSDLNKVDTKKVQ
jgi:hypothetical protein